MSGNPSKTANVIYLHHSTGGNVWRGGVPEGVAAYNAERGVDYQITEREFPKDEPYGWANYPYDYWNIWVKNAGPEQFMEEDTLEILTKKYDVIVFKHCYPVSSVKEDAGQGDVSSEKKTIANYKLQYAALKEKMRSFPGTKFVVWTGALLAEDDTNPDDAKRAKAFFDWARDEWDEPGDNIFVWDFATIEGGGGLYLAKEYQENPGDSHPGPEVCKKAASLFVKRLTDVIEGRGDEGSLTGA